MANGKTEAQDLWGPSGCSSGFTLPLALSRPLLTITPSLDPIKTQPGLWSCLGFHSGLDCVLHPSKSVSTSVNWGKASPPCRAFGKLGDRVPTAPGSFLQLIHRHPRVPDPACWTQGHSEARTALRGGQEINRWVLGRQSRGARQQSGWQLLETGEVVREGLSVHLISQAEI